MVDRGTFRQIFENHWNEFKERHQPYAGGYYEAVVQKMLGCGKEEGGYSEYLCTFCGKDLRRIGFTCKSCFCLSCCKRYTDDFVAQVSGVLQPGVKYRHMILTIPELLRIVFYRDRHVGKLLSALMRCGYECLEAVVSKAARQKVKIGAIVVVQTHGRSGHYNAHLHIIMSSGGINEETGKWLELGYFPYEIIHKKWQYHLFKMLKEMVPTAEMKSLIDTLWKKYPRGLVAHVTKGKVPEQCRGLAKYLAKYVASPPIAIRRIIRYTGEEVTYWYKDHQTKKKEVITVNVMTFIGRMVQHILPKGFQRIRYYGLQATKTYKKWMDVIKEGLRRAGRVIKGTYEVIACKKYRERYQEMSGRDPLICRFCGREMDLWKVWHPKYGTIYDEWENLKAGKYERAVESKNGTSGAGGYSLWPPSGGVQLSLYSVRV
ncbi:MAG: transposase [Desulfoferrobacter sp.]